MAREGEEGKIGSLRNRRRKRGGGRKGREEGGKWGRG